jgi:hypothetical protein
MYRSKKPIQKCYSCELNLGDHCWLHENPREQWAGGRCPDFENEAAYRRYQDWLRQPHVKTLKDIRRSASSAWKKPRVHTVKSG